MYLLASLGRVNHDRFSIDISECGSRRRNPRTQPALARSLVFPRIERISALITPTSNNSSNVNRFVKALCAVSLTVVAADERLIVVGFLAGRVRG
jgi:hypothetical protein